MAFLPIRKYGDPVLRLQAQPVTEFDVELAIFVENMIETMQASEGIGLAAPQVGVSQALCVVDIGLIEKGKQPQAFINPEIIEEFGDEVVLEEGCLSLPDVRDDVARREGIRLRYQDLQGEQHEMQCQGLLARVLMHEIDHLHGIFFTDRLGPLKRRLLAKKLRAIAAEAQKEMLQRQMQHA